MWDYVIGLLICLAVSCVSPIHRVWSLLLLLKSGVNGYKRVKFKIPGKLSEYNNNEGIVYMWFPSLIQANIERNRYVTNTMLRYKNRRSQRL